MRREENQPQDKAESAEKAGQDIESEQAGKNPEFAAQMEIAREVMQENRETLGRLVDS